MRTSMRPTTAWTTTHATCTSPEHALRARNLCHTLFILSHMHLMAQVWVSSLVIHVHVRFSLSSTFSPSTSTCLSLSSSFPSTSCTSSCTLSSTTWSPCKTRASPRTRRVTTSPHRLWAQLHGLQRAQRLFRFLLLHYPVIGPGHGWRDTRQAAHRGTPRTSRLLRTRRRVSQSVVVVCCVRWIRETWWREKMSINQLVLVPQEIRTVLTASFLKTPKLRKWSIDHGNLMSVTARKHRLGLWFLDEIQNMMTESKCEPQRFKGRIIFMSMFYGIVWGEKGNTARCEFNSPRRFPRGHWSFLGPGSEEKRYGTYTDKPDGSWNHSAENTTANFSVPLREENYEGKEEARSQMVVMKASSCFSAQWFLRIRSVSTEQ